MEEIYRFPLLQLKPSDFQLLADKWATSPPTCNDLPEVWCVSGGEYQAPLEFCRRTFYNLNRQMRRDPSVAHLLRAVRATLLLADSAGSGLSREQHDITAWVQSAFSPDNLITSEVLEGNIIQPRLLQIVRARGQNGTATPFKWSDFQDAAEGLSFRALLLAPCGSGKTLAAWRWIKGQLSTRSAARVIFLYPTRATATEGFCDYVSWAPESDGALVSGTAAYDLQGMFENVSDDRSSRDYSTEDRLYALAYWQRRIFSATVDQFLGLMQHSYRFSCLLPLLADCVLVLDEVHSYDKSLFSCLKAFLREFDLPVLCMTASLPPQRLSELRECGLSVYPAEDGLPPDLAETACLSRYRVDRLSGREEAEKAAQTALLEGKRVLWVVNTVARCQELARSFEQSLCYHSRFRLCDRKNRHGEVIQAFRAGARPAQDVLAITTQVCEMSLDLDADVLITETAPITALIQRMGCCCRSKRFGDGSDRMGEVLIYSAPAEAPYASEELSGVPAFLEALDGQEVSQARLEELLERHGEAAPEPGLYAAFLESGPWAESREASLREESDFTVQAVLDTDVPEYLLLRKCHKPWDGLLTPAPKKLARRHPQLGLWPLTVPATHYHPRLGLLDYPL